MRSPLRQRHGTHEGVGLVREILRKAVLHRRECGCVVVRPHTGHHEHGKLATLDVFLDEDVAECVERCRHLLLQCRLLPHQGAFVDAQAVASVRWLHEQWKVETLRVRLTEVAAPNQHVRGRTHTGGMRDVLHQDLRWIV